MCSRAAAGCNAPETFEGHGMLRTLLAAGASNVAEHGLAAAYEQGRMCFGVQRRASRRATRVPAARTPGGHSELSLMTSVCERHRWSAF